MIHRKEKFVFIHITKAAGQSVELAFGYTQEKSPMNGEFYVLGWSKEHKNWISHWTMKSYIERGLLSGYEYQTFFKFAFVRNPWARMVSEYHWKGGRMKGTSFKQFLKMPYEQLRKKYRQGGFDQHLRPQYLSIYADDGTLMVDFIGKVKNMKEDWEYVEKKLGRSIVLPRVNKTKHKHYSEYYDNETIGIIEERYGKDISLFNYSFEDKR